MQPLGDRVLITPDPLVEETQTGIIVTQTWQPETTGVIAAIGEKVREVKVGDHVVFGWQAGQEVTLDLGESRYLLMREADLLAILDPEPDMEGAPV